MLLQKHGNTNQQIEGMAKNSMPPFTPPGVDNSNETTPKMSIGQIDSKPHIGQIINTVGYARAVHVAAQLDLADLLKDGPKSVEEIAMVTQTHAPSLYRLLRALASIGIFTETAAGSFANNDQSAFLRSDHPSAFYYMARFIGADWNWQTWGAMLYSIQTGKPAFDHVYGMSIWRYFAEKDPEAAKVFNAAMTAYSTVTCTALAQTYDFSTVRTVVDVGGGQGLLLKTLLLANPALHGVLADREQVLSHAQEILTADERIKSRCTLITCDMLQAIPVEADIYIFKNIIHDWDDTHATRILKNCRQAMKEDGKLLLAERVIDAGNGDPFGKFLDIQMLLKMQGGKERTEAEYQALLASAGFSLARVIPVNDQISLIEALPLAGD